MGHRGLCALGLAQICRARSFSPRPLVGALIAASAMLLACGESQVGREAFDHASIRIAASQRLNPIRDLLCGRFAEFMFENIKQGLWAGILVNRGCRSVSCGSPLLGALPGDP